MSRRVIIDGNTAAADIAYRVNDVCAIYPITPSSPMAELADQWMAEGRTNIWGEVPQVVEMQSEAGAAGTIHGALQGGALTTTFTASQGLLLMMPNMYKIAGELTPAVFHVAARSLAAQGLSIFGDHQDVMAVRATGFGQLCASSVQAAHDFALVAQAVSLKSRVPFMHFFDGFRTSHEMGRVELLGDEQVRAMIDEDAVLAHRARALNPNRPVIRGTAQNPDVYFQARETVNPFYSRLPGIVTECFERLAELTGRRYRLFDYFGAPDAERVIVIMGSGAETCRETVEHLNQGGEAVGVLRVNLFRPFCAEAMLSVLPETVRAIAVLDRTKEPGAPGEPLYLDVLSALQESAHWRDRRLSIVSGRYGLSSKEFTPAMVKAVLDNLAEEAPRNHFTIGIHDDLGNTSLDYDPAFRIRDEEVLQAVFYGLGSDGTVGASKNSIKIIGEDPDRHVQAYFVYDSKKAGSRTVSHLRFGPRPIRSAYLVDQAQFVGCHKFDFIRQIDVLEVAATGATVLLNAPFSADRVWDELPRPVQEQVIARDLKLYVIDAGSVAQESGLGNRINTVMQTCFFALSGVLPRARAIERIKAAIDKTYAAKGEEVVRRNHAAVDRALENQQRVEIPAQATGERPMTEIVSDDAPEFVRRVTAAMLAGRGDELPVSALPNDGTYPSGTTRWEKRAIADFVPMWEPDLCIQCGNCVMVCPHASIRSKLVPQSALGDAPEGFQHAPIDARGFPETRYALAVYGDDCTGCVQCVEVCPVRSPEASGRRALNMVERLPIAETQRTNERYFESLPYNDRGRVDFGTVRGAQFLQPLFEFSGACAGCGETPYLKLISQLFGDRLMVANATGCSSIYGGNLPTTPWSTNGEGRGPAWSNSLFEDNAEFGLGMRVAADGKLNEARRLLRKLALRLELDVDTILEAPQRTESELRRQRDRVADLCERLESLDDDPEARRLLSVADQLVRRSVWIVGGDGWAYDIGSAGVDHVLASGRDVNLLVLDTEVYSNTGGQASKATPLGAVAKFAFGGKQVPKKDLALQAIAYGNVYVARVAMGSNPQQALLALREAEAYPGPALILAYSHCIAHGINMQYGIDQQKRAVHSGYWPLIRYNPEVRASGENPFILDSPRPTLALSDYADQELRYRMLRRTNPAEAERLMRMAAEHVTAKYRLYEEMAAGGEDAS